VGPKHYLASRNVRGMIVIDSSEVEPVMLVDAPRVSGSVDSVNKIQE